MIIIKKVLIINLDVSITIKRNEILNDDIIWKEMDIDDYDKVKEDNLINKKRERYNYLK